MTKPPPGSIPRRAVVLGAAASWPGLSAPEPSNEPAPLLANDFKCDPEAGVIAHGVSPVSRGIAAYKRSWVALYKDEKLIKRLDFPLTKTKVPDRFGWRPWIAHVAIWRDRAVACVLEEDNRWKLWWFSMKNGARQRAPRLDQPVWDVGLWEPVYIAILDSVGTTAIFWWRLASQHIRLDIVSSDGTAKPEPVWSSRVPIDLCGTTDIVRPAMEDRVFVGRGNSKLGPYVILQDFESKRRVFDVEVKGGHIDVKEDSGT